MKLFSYLSMLGLLFVASPGASAFEIALSEQQLNSLIQVSFPLQQDYQGYHVSLTDPKVQLFGAKQSVSVKTVIIAQKQGQTLRAIARAEGKVHYNSTDKVIEIIKPALVEFSVLDNSIAQSEDAISTIKQAIGQQLPMIFLIDLKQINQFFPGVQPSNIVIRDNALIINL